MEELIPSKFYLSQNSPNPFKDNIKIKYCLPVKTKVYLTVFNSEGELVKELVNNVQDAGTYEIMLSCFDFPCGDYYLQLQAGDPFQQSGQSFNKLKRMVVMR